MRPVATSGANRHMSISHGQAAVTYLRF